MSRRTLAVPSLLCLGLLAAIPSGRTLAAEPTTGTKADQSAFFGPAEFLEKSYIFYSMPAPSPNPTSYGPEGTRTPTAAWLLFEAHPALHFYFWNRLREFTENPTGKPEWLFAPSFTFESQIRFLHTTSNPVRTPSYMPRLNFQLFRIDFNPRPSVKFRELELVVHVGHHSDGQEYCEFTQNQLDEGHCPAFDTGHPDYSRTNLINGSFGTSYFSGGFHQKLVTDVDRNDYARTSYSYGAIFEYNTHGILPGDLSATEYKLYGPYRARVEFEFERMTDLTIGTRTPTLLGNFRVAAMGQAIFATGPGIAPYQLWVEASRTFLQLGGAGVFARFFSGQDYYNINFVHRIDWQAHAGLIIDFASPVYFGRARHPEWH